MSMFTVCSGFPYFHEKSKTMEAIYKQKYHLLGVLVHGVGSWVYTMTQRFKADSNVTIEILQRVLTEIELKKGALPRKLCLQMDNCAKENKNKYVLGYLNWLVQRGVFEEIELSFLPVGHTHEDIDQMFSRIAIALRSRDAATRDDLITIVRDAFEYYGSQPTCHELTTVADVSAWMEPYLNDIHGQSNREILHFQFLKHEVYGVMMKTKKRSAHPWQSYKDNLSDGFHLLRVDGVDSIPMSFLGVVGPKPAALADIAAKAKRVAKDLQLLEKKIAAGYENRVTKAHLIALTASALLLQDPEPPECAWPHEGRFCFEWDSSGIADRAVYDISPEDAASARRQVICIRADGMDMGLNDPDEDDDEDQHADSDEEIDLTKGTLRTKRGELDRVHAQKQAQELSRLRPTLLDVGHLIVVLPEVAVEAAVRPNKRKNKKTKVLDCRRFWLGRIDDIDRTSGTIWFNWLTPYNVSEKKAVQTNNIGKDLTGSYTADVVSGGAGADHEWLNLQEIEWTDPRVLYCFTALETFEQGGRQYGTIPGAVKVVLEAHLKGQQLLPIPQQLADTRLRGAKLDNFCNTYPDNWEELEKSGVVWRDIRRAAADKTSAAVETEASESDASMGEREDEPSAVTLHAAAAARSADATRPSRQAAAASVAKQAKAKEASELQRQLMDEVCEHRPCDIETPHDQRARADVLLLFDCRRQNTKRKRTMTTCRAKTTQPLTIRILPPLSMRGREMRAEERQSRPHRKNLGEGRP